MIDDRMRIAVQIAIPDATRRRLKGRTARSVPHHERFVPVSLNERSRPYGAGALQFAREGRPDHPILHLPVRKRRFGSPAVRPPQRAIARVVPRIPIKTSEAL